jgi:hypothetical protein
MPKTVKVSIALHTREPDPDGNQWDGGYEATYGGYNRQHVMMEIDNNGDGFARADAITFPNVNSDPETFSFFSVGVAMAPSGQGGSIIIAGPLEPPFYAAPGTSPQLKNFAIGVYRKRLDEMRADGRFFDHVEPDHKRGLNIP